MDNVDVYSLSQSIEVIVEEGSHCPLAKRPNCAVNSSVESASCIIRTRPKNVDHMFGHLRWFIFLFYAYLSLFSPNKADHVGIL